MQSKQFTRSRPFVLGVTGLFLIFFSSFSTARSQAREVGQSAAEYCQRNLAHDYMRPFARMPRVPLPPESGVLPFGPAHTELISLSDSVIVGAGEVGFDLSVGEGARTTWIMNTRLSKVDSQGHVGELVGTSRRKIDLARASRSPTPTRFAFKIGAKPAFYLLTVTFKSKGDKLLGRYAQYLRVVHPRLRVRLVTDSSTYRSGSTAYFRIENVGTSPVGPLNEAFAIERHQGNEWSKDPYSPVHFARNLLPALPGGAIGFCRDFVIPAEMQPGVYRFRKDVILPSGKSKKLTARFEVLG